MRVLVVQPDPHINMIEILGGKHRFQCEILLGSENAIPVAVKDQPFAIRFRSIRSWNGLEMSNTVVDAAVQPRIVQQFHGATSADIRPLRRAPTTGRSEA